MQDISYGRSCFFFGEFRFPYKKSENNRNRLGKQKSHKNFQLRPEIFFYTKTKSYNDDMDYRNNYPRLQFEYRVYISL